MKRTSEPRAVIKQCVQCFSVQRMVFIQCAQDDPGDSDMPSSVNVVDHDVDLSRRIDKIPGSRADEGERRYVERCCVAHHGERRCQPPKIKSLAELDSIDSTGRSLFEPRNAVDTNFQLHALTHFSSFSSCATAAEVTRADGGPASRSRAAVPATDGQDASGRPDDWRCRDIRLPRLPRPRARCATGWPCGSSCPSSR